MNFDVKFWLFMTVCIVALIALIMATTNRRPAASKVDGVRVAVIDGCEYIDNVTYLGYNVYTHKGNCTNHPCK